MLPVLVPMLAGSSPRVWGQVNNNTIALNHLRIIPTRVGTRGYRCILRAVKLNHPHACGDKGLTLQVFQHGVGSSPRVWGQVQDFYDVVNNYRIIPTRVGTSDFGRTVALLEWDHPHACGDKAQFVDKSQVY